MNLAEYEKMYHLEDTYWWFQGRRRIIEAILEAYLPKEPEPGRVLDVGCGTGLILDHFRKWEPVGLDFHPVALQYCSQRKLTRLVNGDVTQLPFESGSFDLILALDLMEHVEDHERMIREFSRVLRKGGCLMATVPAHPFLWSDHDIALHHYRRYTKASLRRLLREGDFRPIKFSYGITFTFPPIVAFRMVQKLWHGIVGSVRTNRPKAHLIELRPSLNRTMIRLLQVEAALLRRMNLPFGVSLMTLAQKR